MPQGRVRSFITAYLTLTLRVPSRGPKKPMCPQTHLDIAKMSLEEV